MGDCGGPLSERLVQIEGFHDYGPDGWEGARVRDGVVEISGDRVMKPSAGMQGVAFASCPVAGVDRGTGEVAGVFRAYRAWGAGQLALVEPEPSAALLEAVDLVGTTFSEIRNYEIESRKKTKAPKP